MLVVSLLCFSSSSQRLISLFSASLVKSIEKFLTNHLFVVPPVTEFFYRFSVHTYYKAPSSAQNLKLKFNLVTRTAAVTVQMQSNSSPWHAVKIPSSAAVPLTSEVLLSKMQSFCQVIISCAGQSLSCVHDYK